MKQVLALMLILVPGLAPADILVAKRTLRAQSVITSEDVALQPGQVAGILAAPEEAVGLETRAIIYAGRPIRYSDLGEPAIVERNQIIPLIYRQSGLEIRTEGRALQRAGAGETIRVMNAASKAVVSAWIAPDGSARVSQ
ncbi:flagellar basal body P-ring formation chaperone FlgA [Thioclava pacifica]|uniref:Flagella basal body P-ring formation protein FlgA n=1 Tax=Thioclava pacifica DSM 10166 TaxID=1353537 RepID=A0A074JG55_9RHOB|nr:flagellar basal body P-ring formation chaperone FlgA [Thioclava pacifica]KEO54548.1 hypothetical protein TP2_06350 [Thioclava pacifica DSM 10166]